MVAACHVLIGRPKSPLLTLTMTSSTYCSNPCYRSRIYLNFNMKTSQYILILSLFVLLAGVLSTKVRVVPFDLCHEKPLNLSAYPSENSKYTIHRVVLFVVIA